MLDTITKKNIDDCRDVLVGIVPDPKSQIEQITLALIYKFMDDMDKEAVEKFKGKAKFFTAEYAKYSWRKLFDPSLGGMEVVKLYSDAIESFESNPNIPVIFREIFKNGSSALRKNAPTLKLFLKHIDVFEYSHSEKLGDAFEYLLSVMGSQGDAGQFRTPRHIIDFVTACVNPQKNETVLDPACGTAGFLLSAYKHILNTNTTPLSLGEGSGVRSRPGSSLKPDDRKKLATNFVGYDISPDMVRLSLANMYLHGFATPLIHEYDTLSSEDRWQETFDVILANPPFMTPKGGIRPHKKFGVQANKAEVLFTDYIAEHLNPNGRAGIVVPNGIVATSQTAYKQLRKMLVQDSLLAVISLPAGVFQPYSGVKTSVLILDKKLAKKSQHILFLKIENDGFDLGAQRREIDKNDLPLALKRLQQYKEALTNEKNIDEIKNIVQNPKDSNDYRKNGVQNNATPSGSNNLNVSDAINIKSLRDSLATLVEKEIVLGNKDVVLSAERYFEKGISQTEFELVKLGDYYEIFNGFAFDSANIVQNKNDDCVPIIKIGNVIHGEDIKVDVEFISKSLHQNRKNAIFKGDAYDVFIALSGATTGKISKLPDSFIGKEFGLNQRVALIKSKSENASSKYLYYVLLKGGIYETLLGLAHGAAQPNLSSKQISELEIPLPPLEIQQQIVAEIEDYQKIIDGAKQIVNNYKPSISINPDWEMVELGEVIDSLEAGVSVNSEGRPAEIGECGILKTSAVTYGTFLSEENKVILPKELERAKCNPKKDSIIISRMNTEQLVGASAYVAKDFPNLFIPDRLWQTVISRKDVSVKYIHFIISSPEYRRQLSEMCAGTSGSMKNITKGDLLRLTIPLPTLEEQADIVERIEEEQALVNGNKILITLFEQKIKSKINEVWGVKEEVEIN